MLFFQRVKWLNKMYLHSFHLYRCTSNKSRNEFKEKLKNGPDLKEFILATSGMAQPTMLDPPQIPYLSNDIENVETRKIFFDVYGCQMNLNDTEIVWSILKKSGFEKTELEEEADIFLVMTCAVREGAESKIWHRLDHLRGFKRRRALSKNKNKPVKIGILGCMAERLKEKLIEKEKAVDVDFSFYRLKNVCMLSTVAGPDSYRDLPRLLALTDSGQTAVNVLLSLDETYADVMPVSLNQNKISAFVSIMRGCDNMCTYCIVPFTRGRERSRPVSSLLDEVRHLADRGVREVTLLGQNVNSYRDVAQRKEPAATQLAKGFKTVYKSKIGGLRFADLLDRVSAIDPEMRIRFTAAHPKDFPDEVLEVISERSNICKLLHLPAQSGSSSVLERMRRGYTRGAYLDLVETVKRKIPGVGLSTDMICGFCGETEEEFQETLSLMEMVDYSIAFLFPYSMREKTAAYRRYKDDVPDDVKKDRHKRMIQLYRRKCQALNEEEVGNVHLVLVEGNLKKTGEVVGRNEFYLKVAFDQGEIMSEDGGRRVAKPGDYVAVRITSARCSVLSGVALYHTSIGEFYRDVSWGDRGLLRTVNLADETRIQSSSEVS